MKIKWGNVFAFAILICLIILLLRLSALVDRVSPVLWTPYYVHDPAFGILALGLICVTIVAVVKIISGR